MVVVSETVVVIVIDPYNKVIIVLKNNEKVEVEVTEKCTRYRFYQLNMTMEVIAKI